MSWAGLWFRSRTEQNIAQALDRANVLFAANACVRLGITQDHRHKREPDFLVVSNGKGASSRSTALWATRGALLTITSATADFTSTGSRSSSATPQSGATGSQMTS